MSDFTFKNYISLQGEKHLGILEIIAYGKILLRYKVVPNKEGNGWFLSAPALKYPSEQYEPAFLMDSNFAKSEIDQIARANINPFQNQLVNSASNNSYQQQRPAQPQQQQWQQPQYAQPVYQNQAPGGDLPF